jgi:hypothetical protein
MKNIILPVLLLLILTTPLPARAQMHGPFSAADLKGLCTSASDLDYGYCAGYVSAVAHALLETKIGGLAACNHVNVRSQQLVDTFNAWADMFPERLGEDAERAVAASFARAFPCR